MNVDGTTTVEEVDRGIAMLGPGVNGVVRLLDNDGAGYPVGLKLVERFRDNGRQTGIGCRPHRRTDRSLFFQRLHIATEKLDEEVGS